ncbi:MAG TPA: TIGR01777 family oxidoreductase [Polyangiaceae bacterium]|nr:TIGR01777 family oxidoreductase [Polyangiaceae bacterium]
MRILLTGGTGFIGARVTAALEARGDVVVVVSRRPSSAGRASVGWDAIAGEVERADAVVHLAGEPVADERWTPARLERIRSSRVDTTERIARAIVEAPPRPRVFVSASAVGFYGMRRDDAVCDEDTPPGDDVLARICVEWERAAEPARSAGARVVHPRIGVVLGHGGALAKMSKAFRWFVGGPVGDGKQWVSWIHVDDAVRALLLLLDTASLAGPVNLVGPAPVTMNDLARALGKALGRPSALRVPAAALRLALGEGLAELLLTGKRVTPRRLEAAGFVFAFARLEEALAGLV